VSPEDIVKLAQKYDCSGITYTYTEPTVFYELAYDTAKIAHERGMFNTFVTNGYMTTEAVEMIAPYLDAASVNFKGSGNKEFYNNLMSVPKVDPIFTSMKAMKKNGIFIEITNLIIPEVGDSLEDTRTLSRWVVENLGELTPFHLTAFSPTYKLTNLPRTPSSTLEKHIEVAKNEGLVFVYSGNVPGHDYENTYCPECGFKAVERYSVYLKSNDLDRNGNCPKCKKDLNIKGVQWMVQGKGQFRRF
jgi:pyruvate formate lyase activating enzyme